MRDNIQLVQKLGKPIGIILFIICAFFAGNFTTRPTPKTLFESKVLGTKTQVTPTPIVTPLPTTAPITIINNIIMPTLVPTITQGPTPLPQQVVVIATPTPGQPTDTPIPTSVPTLTPTPTPIPQTVEISIDYAGARTPSSYTTSISVGESAWQAVQDAVGAANLQYKDYGGSLGIFITGFNGINAGSNQYYDFQVNGISSNVGVSSYDVQNHDVLKFVLTSF